MEALSGRRGGRPSRPEVRRQTRDFVAALARSGVVTEAVRVSGISERRALRLLDEPHVRAVLLRAVGA